VLCTIWKDIVLVRIVLKTRIGRYEGQYLRKWRYELHHNVFDVTLTDNFQRQIGFVDSEDIIWWDQKKNVIIYQ